MKPRHTAALALVGWYLMIPPVIDLKHKRRYEADTDAPLSKWKQSGSYDSADACEKDKWKRLHFFLDMVPSANVDAADRRNSRNSVSPAC
jgi:hypothetical protein